MAQKICYTNSFLDLSDHDGNNDVIERCLLNMMGEGEQIILWVNEADFDYMRIHYTKSNCTVNLFVQFTNVDTAIHIFIHCKPTIIPNKMIVLFANLKQYADFLCCSKYTLCHLYKYEKLPEQLKRSCQLIRYTEDNKFIRADLSSARNWANNNVNEVITFHFLTRPILTHVEGIPLYIISYDQLLQFKKFLIRYIYGKENIRWAINEEEGIIDCLFKTLIDEENLIHNYFPKSMPNYWFAIPRCKDYRSTQLQTESDNEHSRRIKRWTFKLTTLMSLHMYTSYMRPFYNPLHNGLILSLLQCDAYAHNDHLYKRNGFGYEQYNLNGIRVI